MRKGALIILVGTEFMEGDRGDVNLTVQPKSGARSGAWWRSASRTKCTDPDTYW